MKGCGDGGEEGEVPGVVGEAQDILQSLVERMVRSEPEDFELVRNTCSFDAYMLAGSLEFRLIDLCSELNIQEYPRSAHSLFFPTLRTSQLIFLRAVV